MEKKRLGVREQYSQECLRRIGNPELPPEMIAEAEHNSGAGLSGEPADYAWLPGKHDAGADFYPVSAVEPIGALERIVEAIVAANPHVSVPERGSRSRRKKPEQWRIEQVMRHLVGQEPRKVDKPSKLFGDEDRLMRVAEVYHATVFGSGEDKPLPKIVAETLEADEDFQLIGEAEDPERSALTPGQHEMVQEIRKKFEVHKERLLSKLNHNPTYPGDPIEWERIDRDIAIEEIIRLLSVLGYARKPDREARQAGT